MKTCPSCGVENPDTSRFCMTCGNDIGPTCPSCGTNLLPDAGFCGSCGAAVGPTSGRRESRRLVTILFADVVGSTARSEGLDPEDARELMASYFDAMSEEIRAEGGTVEKYIGDAIMAVFGVPTAHEDDPLRAVRAGRRLLVRLREWNASGGYDLAIRIGINTGDVLAGGAAGQDLLVTGDPVNVAARLEQGAAPGTILVGDRTARSVRGEFELRELERIEAKGKSGRVAAWEVVDERTIVQDRGIPGLHAPMVGRSGQLSVLESSFGAVRDQGRPHLVTIVADAGVGKSRLMREFTARVGADAQIVSGRCLPYGEGVALWPLAEVLRSEAGILHTDASDEAIRKIEKFTRATSGDRFDRLTVAALAVTLELQLPDDPLADFEPRRINRELLGSWRGVFSALATDRPVVFVVEDIHWADELMLEILEDLADGVEGPLLIVASARPDLLRTRSDWGGGRRNHSFVPLDPLTPDQSAELVELLLDVEELPAALKQRILSRSDGNPFFLEEIIRRLIDEGMLSHVEGRWRASADIDDVEIPDTVQAVILSRLDLLTPAERTVIQHAAVVGRVFWLTALESLGAADDLDTLMRTLRRRELVMERLTSSMAGETEYIFKHILIRDVAYESIPRRARGPLHLAVARWIEEHARERLDELSELLLHHYGIAFELTGDEGLRDLAQEFAWRSVENAVRKFAVGQAETLGRRAVELSRPGIERVAAFERFGDALTGSFLGDVLWDVFTGGIRELREAGLDDDATLARLAAKASQFPTRWSGSMSSQPPVEEIQDVIDSGLAAAGDGDSRERAMLLSAEAGMRFARLKPADEAGERAAREAVAIAERLDDPNLLSNCLDGLSSHLIPECRYREIHELNERRAALIPVLSDSIEICDIHNMSAWDAFHTGRYRDSVTSARAAVEAGAEEAGFLLHGLTWLVVGLCVVGEWDEATDAIEQMIRLQGDDARLVPPPFSAPAYGAALFIAEVRQDAARVQRYTDAVAGVQWAKMEYDSHPFLIRTYIHRGDLETARAGVNLKEGFLLDLMLEVYCDVLVEDPSLGDAEEALARADEVAERGGLLALPLYATRLRARLAELAGEVDRADEQLRQAAAGFDELGATWEAARTRLLGAEILARSGSVEAARREAGHALATFERLGAVREIERARAFLEA